jgi:CRP/FNR family transcriptional regulator, anaerobic regulatory protein
MTSASVVPANENCGALSAQSRIEPTLPMPNGEVRTIAANEFLFQSGDARTHIYRIESGAICSYQGRTSDRPSLIEFLFPGDFVGLGFLDHHALNARALLPTKVACIPVAETEDALKGDALALARLAQAADREIEARREELVKAGQRQPVERVAALLVTSSRTNTQQGRRADVIEDSWRCGVIADLLQLDLDDLTAILVDLERRGLVESTAGALRLKDIPALESLADRLSTRSAHVEPKPARAPKLVSRTAA